MRSALDGRPLCESCSDPIDRPELVDIDGGSFHRDCWHATEAEVFADEQEQPSR